MSRNARRWKQFFRPERAALRDDRYDRVTCPDCGQSAQRIDARAWTSHALDCPTVLPAASAHCEDCGAPVLPEYARCAACEEAGR